MTTETKLKKRRGRPVSPGRPKGSKNKQPGRYGPCGRLREPPSPNAIAWTLRDYQAIGGPGKTSIYDTDKQRREKGEKPLLFKDAFGRSMVDGDVGRELLLNIKENEDA